MCRVKNIIGNFAPNPLNDLLKKVVRVKNAVTAADNAYYIVNSKLQEKKRFYQLFLRIWRNSKIKLRLGKFRRRDYMFDCRKKYERSFPFEKLHNKHIKEGLYEWRASIKCNLSAHNTNNGIQGIKTLSNIWNVKGKWQTSIRSPPSKLSTANRFSLTFAVILSR